MITVLGPKISIVYGIVQAKVCFCTEDAEIGVTTFTISINLSLSHVVDLFLSGK